MYFRTELTTGKKLPSGDCGKAALQKEGAKSGIEFGPHSAPAWKGCPEDCKMEEVRCSALRRLAGAAPHLSLLPPTKKDKMLV